MMSQRRAVVLVFVLAGLLFLFRDSLDPAALARLGVTLVSVVGAIGLIVAVLVLVIVGVEVIRRRRADRGGFQAFVKRGAPHRHPDLIQALTEGLGRDGAWFTPMPLGPLPLISGRIVAGDPAFFLSDPPEPFGVTVTPGTYPLILLHATLPDNRAAALAVKLGDGAVERLEPAWRPGDLDHARRRRELPSLGVDSGQMALGSLEALEAWRTATLRPDLGVDSVGGTNPFTSGNPHSLWSRTDTRAGPIYSVLSGWGDGSYPAWFARSAAGLPVWLIVDFGLLDEARPI